MLVRATARQHRDPPAGHCPPPSAEHPGTPAQPPTADRKRLHPTGRNERAELLQGHPRSPFHTLVLRQPGATGTRAACPVQTQSPRSPGAGAARVALPKSAAAPGMALASQKVPEHRTVFCSSPGATPRRAQSCASSYSRFLMTKPLMY